MWFLRPMAQKPTSNPLPIDFAKLPSQFQQTARRIVWALINERTPVEDLTRATAIRDRVTAGTIAAVFHDVRWFFNWLNERNIASLDAVSEADFLAYSEHVAGRPVVRGVKGRMLFTVTRIWLLAPYLPAGDVLRMPTWERPETEGGNLNDIVGPANWTGENKTRPIHPQSMSALLLCALRFVNVFASDIVNALNDKRAMQDGIPSRTAPDARDVVSRYEKQLRESGRPLPGTLGRVNTGPNGESLAVQYLAATLRVSPEAVKHLLKSGLPVQRGAPMPTTINGRVNGAPWTSSVDYYELDEMRRLLSVACFVVTAYLSGMRIEECRALERGCCVADEPAEGVPPHYRISGRSFKGALDDDGNTIPGGTERENPWLVLEPVARAIAVSESLQDTRFVFGADSFNVRGGTDNRPVTAASVRIGIRELIAWWNRYCENEGEPYEAIPADPDGEISPARFRRTLAWFIYRIPGGRIALGLQYGHLRGYTSDGYGSRAVSGLRDVFPMEEALAVAEALGEAAQRLDAGEQVSGPAASRYIAGVRSFQQTFEGSFLSSRQMAALRRDPTLRIYDNPVRAMACVYDQGKALCHPERDRSSVDASRTPDPTRCVDGCGNTARTDTHADLLRLEIAALKEEAESPLTPEPIRERLLERVERREAVLQAHSAERRPA
jgi:integrase